MPIAFFMYDRRKQFNETLTITLHTSFDKILIDIVLKKKYEPKAALQGVPRCQAQY